MTYSILYIIGLFLYSYGTFAGFEFQTAYILFSPTNTLIAFGVIAICNRLDKLIEKKS